MIFNFLKYTRPVWYYNLKPKKDNGYFPTEKQLLEAEVYLEKDTNYKSKTAQIHDLSWTAFQSGFIASEPQNGVDVWKKNDFPVEDEYRFLRKNIHQAWVLYVLLIRLITLNNPFKEISGFLKTRKVKRIDFSKHIISQVGYEDYKSQLVHSNPLVSIVIPTLNRYEYLKDVFRDLEQQTYKNFEVIVVDQTDDFDQNVYQGWKLHLNFSYQEEKALCKARNEAIKSSKGEFILLYDDDSLVESNWIEQHLKALDFFKADLSSGVSLSKVGAEIPSHYNFFCWSSQLDTGNVLLKKEIFRKIGLLDRQFEKQVMEDAELGLRSYLAGYKNISNPYAKRIHLKASEGGLRQVGGWDSWRPKKFFDPRPVPSVLYFSRKYFGKEFSVFYILNSILPSLVPYKFKKNKFLKVLSFVSLPVVFPLIFFQIFKSWNMASVKLQQKSRITILK